MNHYQTLGIDKSATGDDIKRAYRKLASQNHPDKGGDKTKFQEIQNAYSILGDENKRAAYDNPQPQFNGFSQAYHQHTPFDLDAIFNQFGARFSQQGQQRRSQTHAVIWVTLQDVAIGGNRTVGLGSQHGAIAAEIEIPLGVADGDSLIYNGLAPGGGDLVITYRIHPHPQWQRDGANITADRVISIWECITGTEVMIRDIVGNQLSLSVPPRTQPGSTLRLRGRGLKQRNGPQGDFFVRIQAKIPDVIDEELLKMIEKVK
jgi:DnaJ-class molecular chaperone